MSSQQSKLGRLGLRAAHHWLAGSSASQSGAISQLSNASSTLLGSCSSSQLGTRISPDATPQASCSYATSSGSGAGIRWVFLGPPGVGKGTYASRVSKQLGIAHIATGDLIRDEIKAGSAVGKQMQGLVNSGKLVPDSTIFELLQQRLDKGRSLGEKGFILDGFPRTRAQAEQVLKSLDIQLALNMGLREEVLVEKCLGRRLCKHCGKNYNIANIYLPAGNGRPEIKMPPLDPPAECAPHLEQRDDDTEPVIRRRLQVYRDQAAPVEDVFRAAGLLLDFEITAGIPETMPGLLAALKPYMQGK